MAFAEDPIGYHLDAYRRHGPIYRTQFRNQEWVAIAGIEANDLCWTNADVWSYQKAMAGFGEELGFVHVTTLDGVPHRRKRRALGSGFRASVVFRHLPAMAAAIAERFEGGTHVCLGKSVTRVHAPVVLANLIKDYRMELQFTPDFHYRVDLGGAGHREPMPARFTPRS